MELRRAVHCWVCFQEGSWGLPGSSERKREDHRGRRVEKIPEVHWGSLGKIQLEVPCQGWN